MRRVVVVGSGVAGTAAALAASHEGARVHVVLGAAGASRLAGGALDWDDWQTGPPRRVLSTHGEEAFSALDFGSLPDSGVIVATTAGIVRPAAGADHALLDLDRTGRGAILVPRCDHPTWDAPALARAWGDSPLASERALTFVALDVALARYRDERLVGDVEIAARHDDDARLEWLAERLREVLARNPGFVGVALPPWLGARRSRAEVLSQKVGIRCGEALVGLASASGARFDHARAEAFVAAHVDVVADWAKRIDSVNGVWRVVLEEGDPLEADAVVIATGGLVGGGLVYSPGDAANAAELPPDAPHVRRRSHRPRRPRLSRCVCSTPELALRRRARDDRMAVRDRSLDRACGHSRRRRRRRDRRTVRALCRGRRHRRRTARVAFGSRPRRARGRGRSSPSSLSSASLSSNRSGT